MSKLEIAVCAYCGSREVQADAYAAWDFASQSWELVNTFDKGAYCEQCDGETRIETEYVDGDIENQHANYLAGQRLHDAAQELKGLLADCCEQLGIIQMNAVTIPDPRMGGTTDVNAVPLGDIETIGPLLERVNALLQRIDTPPSAG